MDSGKLITNDEHDESVVTHSEHYYINNKCVDCREDEPFTEVDPYKDEPPLTGSAFSEYSLPVIVGISAAVVFGVGGFFLGRKKKKNVE